MAGGLIALAIGNYVGFGDYILKGPKESSAASPIVNSAQMYGTLSNAISFSGTSVISNKKNIENVIIKNNNINLLKIKY